MPAFILLLFSLSLLTFTSINAQNTSATIDKLKLELTTNLTPRKEASILSDLTWYYSTLSIDSALHYGEKAKMAAFALADSLLLAQVYSDIGAVYFRKGDFDQSKQNYLSSYAIRKTTNDAKGMAKINNNLANIYEKNQEYELAMTTLLDALGYFETINDQKTIHIIKGNIGLILLKTKNYNKAFGYIDDVVKFQVQSNATEDLCVSYLNLGNVYLELNDTLSALKMYEKSVEACKAVGNKSAMSSGYNNIATIKAAQKKNKEAVRLYEETMKMRSELNSTLDKSNFDFNLANEYFKNNELSHAKRLFLNTEKVFEDNESYDKLQLNYNFLIQIYALQNKPDSVAHYSNRLLALNNSLLENKVSEKTVELETIHQSLKKEKLFREQSDETRKQKLIVYRVSVIAFIVALLIYIHHKLKHKRLAKDFEQKLSIAEFEKQNKLQEQRLTISRDLHDNIGSHLTFIISSIDNLKYVYGESNSSLSEKLYSLSIFTKTTIQELRDTIWAMNSSEISFEDLEIQLLNYINKAKDYVSGVSFDFQIQEGIKQQKFSSIEGMNIYRSVQEALNNSLKYAEASCVTIDITQTNNIAKICISDNGKGFDAEKVTKGNGFKNMEKRMHEIGGQCSIQSSAKGSCISLEISTSDKIR